jgi:lipopolysaccharide biosynthesis regulator YciM
MMPNISFEVLVILILFLAVLSLAFYSAYTRKKIVQEKDTPYLQGLKYMAEGEHRRAVEMFKESVRQTSDNLDAYIKLGVILRNEGLYKNAIRIHKDLTLRGNLSPEDLVDIKKNLVLDYWYLKDYHKAELYLNQLLADKDQVDWAAPYLIKIYEKSEEWDKAFNILQKSSLAGEEKGKRKMAQLKVKQAIQLVESKNEKDARVLMKEAQKIYPGCEEAYLYLGDSYMRENRTDDAIKTWTDLLKKIPEQSPQAFKRLEKAWFEKGQFSKIENLYDSMLKDNPENLPAILALSEILRKKGEHAQALKLLESAQKTDLDQDKIKTQMIKIYIDKNQYKDAALLALEVVNRE